MSQGKPHVRTARRRRSPPAAAVPRPPLAFRVGVTGARDLSPHALERLRPAVAEILGLVKRVATKLGKDQRATDVYEPASPEAPVDLRLVSSLAEGADRLVAQEALTAGYALYSPLPFAQAEYEKDFPDTIDAFRALLAQAETLELDGAREIAGESYREAGRYVARNCDLLIAIWDGARQGRVGGTVGFAVGARLPVWRIDATGAEPPRLIDDPAQLRRPDLAPAGDDAAKGVETYLERTIPPPSPPAPQWADLFGFIAHWLGRRRAHDASPLHGYLAEQPLAPRFYWRVFGWLMNWIVPRPDVEALGLAEPATQAERWWDGLYQSADAYSIGYGDRYRSSYVTIAILAFLALAAVAAGIACPSIESFAVALEFVALVGIAALVVANHLHRWHERWISYRLLAELCRKQYVLSSIGWSLPGSEVTRVLLDAADRESPL